MEISKELFKKYLQIQLEGKFNMYTKEAQNAIGCTYYELRNIQENYKQLLEKYPNLRNEVEQEILVKLTK